MTKRITYLMISVATFALTGCTSEWDMQGVDPKDYYAANPIENKIESRSTSHVVRYDPMQSRLSPEEVNRLRGAMREFSPDAAESIQVQMSEADLKNDSRREALTRLLYSLGYTTSNIMFESSATLARDDVQIAITYARVVSPENCPDWRTSPVTSYSNTWQGNFKCADVTNRGLMVADPRDLKKGNGDSGGADSTRASKVIQDYRSGADFGPSAAGAEGESGGTPAATAAAPVVQ